MCTSRLGSPNYCASALPSVVPNLFPDYLPADLAKFQTRPLRIVSRGPETDNLEKLHQVQVMTGIYKLEINVYVWLGYLSDPEEDF
ncbi:hypothetical protein Vi05172_g12009 [Venturia inaequalis]|nr:hypothetical protein Vi05172_g12009 [Venturia inaequalis]